MKRHPVAIFAALLAAAWISLPFAVNGDSSSIEKEAALGRRMAETFRQRTTAIENATVQSYLDGLVQRIAPQIPEAKFPLTASAIVDDPCHTLHEPTVLLGGYMFVPAALFLAAQNEGEFAGMIAQAMERVVQQEEKGLHRANSAQLATIPLVFMGTGCSEQIAPIGQLPKIRANELSADALALGAMAKAGFDPSALLRYIERVQPTSTYTVNTALPDRDARLANMRTTIEQLARFSYDTHNDEFTAIQQEVRRITGQKGTDATPPSLIRH